MIDLRSDTVTKPTDEMRRAMAQAEVGDDVYGEDPTVNLLEEEAAVWLGKEAALLVPTGTMGNQVAVMTHCLPGDEVFVEAEAHLYWYENGGIARLSLAQPRQIQTADGRLTPELLAAALRPANIHYTTARLVCVENTHNRAGGRVQRKADFDALASFAHAQGLKVHLDGARLANAAVAQGLSLAQAAEGADSVMCCLSKGLCAPVGSVLAGTREYIDRARKGRKLLGGGMRQAGVLAAAGLISIRSLVPRLAEDHRLAKAIAEELAQLPGVVCDPANVETNMVMVDLDRPADPVVRTLAHEGLLCGTAGPRRIRLVTHRDVAGVHAGEVAKAFAAALSQ
ncbi:MAG: aminotransferase class I/II-fold pyridoxal phosphate-dependent enzyme [Thermaerobacter sp.]|nr:aminotransferase class I/II-fold pyridoxal phosphate-dependent enzyme [Thermaerobacter sp.]